MFRLCRLSKRIRMPWPTIQANFHRPKCTRSSEEVDFRDIAKNFVSGKINLEKNEDTGIAIISLDNKDKKNAISGSMMCDLEDAIFELEAWDNGKGVILRGEGGTFCSGGDLETVKSILSQELGYKMSCFMSSCLRRFSQLPMISVALVEGVALGGGAELASTCDFIVMSDKAKLGFVQTKMGLITGWGAGTRIVRKFGSVKALDVLASGRIMDAVECKRLGFANELLTNSDNLLLMTESWMAQYCHADKKVVRNLKTMISCASCLSIEQASDHERKLFSELWGGDANANAVQQNIKHR